MCFTRMGILRDSFIFKGSGVVLFFLYFTFVLLPCYDSPLVAILSLIRIFFFKFLVLIPLFAFFDALPWSPRYDGQNWLQR